MLRRDAIQLRAGRVACFLEAGDEDLANLDPIAFREGSGAGLDVIEHVLQPFHRREGMIELGEGSPRGVRVGIHQTGQDQTALQVDQFRARPAMFQDLGVPAHLHDAAGPQGDGFLDGERGVHRDHFSVVQNEVGVRGAGGQDEPAQQAAPRATVKQAGRKHGDGFSVRGVAL